MAVSKRADPLTKEIRKQCLDLWLFDFQWAMLGLLEGNQRATESFRNGMLEVDEDGKARPRPDVSVSELVHMLRTMALQNANRAYILEKG
jgi:hypothetical protein